MITTPRNRTNFKDRMRSKPSWLNKSAYTYFDIDPKKYEWIVRSNTGEFLRWEKRQPMWYARFSHVLVPRYCLTNATIEALPDVPVGERVVG